ncbi:hypothetical protein L6452_09025 [Arctium lappa]|uniref:Uncharacterized protein n=1 Tax=Arctium lappa TaxID=4217 RepID=A0ACB9DJH6_ARCLA|nr:hypothetical protein L6452_09025 [Arctium lappa]
MNFKWTAAISISEKVSLYAGFVHDYCLCKGMPSSGANLSAPVTLVDPYLVLDEDIRLQAICPKPDDNNCYGSQEDEESAMRSLSAIELEDQQLTDTLSVHLASKLGKSSEDQDSLLNLVLGYPPVYSLILNVGGTLCLQGMSLSGISGICIILLEELLNMRALLSQCFLPDDEYPSGAPLFLETPQPCSPVSQMDFQAFDEVMPAVASTDEDACSDQYGSQSDHKALLSINSHAILSVNQLLESVVETAHHVESMPNTSTPVPYDQMKNQCEALVTGKQQKLSVLQSFKKQQEAKAITSSGEHEKQTPISGDWSVHDESLSYSSEYGRQQSFRLPSSCPFDKFLKAARC